jgi:hypothetical protein
MPLDVFVFPRLKNTAFRVNRFVFGGIVCFLFSLEVLENKALRIFGPKRDEVAGGWRELHNEELRDLYSSPSIIRRIKSRMRWAEHVAPMRRRLVYRILAGKSTGRLRRRWDYNIKMDPTEIGWIYMDRTDLAQDRNQWGGSCEHGNEHSCSIKC